MFAVFEKYLQSKASFSEAEIERIQAISLLKTVRKRQYLLQAGDEWSQQAFVTSGCLRTYSVDAKGTEHIVHFAVENWWTGDQESLATGQPSRYNVEAIETSTVLLFRKEAFEELRREIPTFDQVINAIVYRSFLASQNRIHAAISYSAEDKYREFLRLYPAFASRIPQYMVASYLGMTTETLSRIRRHFV
jgi:CRP-like cAMP-binding protein